MNENTAYQRAISIGMSGDGTRIKVCVILDDASRMILAGREFDMLMTFVFSSLDDSRGTINTENSKRLLIKW